MKLIKYSLLQGCSNLEKFLLGLQKNSPKLNKFILGEEIEHFIMLLTNFVKIQVLCKKLIKNILNFSVQYTNFQTNMFEKL